MFDPRNYTLLPHCAHRIEYMYIYIYIFFFGRFCVEMEVPAAYFAMITVAGAHQRGEEIFTFGKSHMVSKKVVKFLGPWCRLAPLGKITGNANFFFGCENNSFLYIFPLHKPIY